jgi:DUF438 domain-containing protein
LDLIELAALPLSITFDDVHDIISYYINEGACEKVVFEKL